MAACGHRGDNSSRAHWPASISVHQRLKVFAGDRILSASPLLRVSQPALVQANYSRPLRSRRDGAAVRRAGEPEF